MQTKADARATFCSGRIRRLMNRSCVRSCALSTVLLAAVLAGAAPSFAEPVPCAPRAVTPESVATPIALAGEVTTVGSQAVEFWVHRAKRPRATLVFENGLMLPLTTWQRVVQELAGEADVLLYNRPGVGRSTLPGKAQDPQATARLLRELLRAQNMPAPYIVVGHSMGGLHAQVFARLYAQDVAAMLLVDALPPGAMKARDEFPWYTQLGLQLFAAEYVQREIAGANAMGAMLLDDAATFDKPVVRLVALPDPAAGKPEGLVADLLEGVIYAEDFGVWAIDPDIAERNLDRLYPQSVVRQLRVHHRVQETAPAAVARAIRELMDGAGYAAF